MREPAPAGAGRGGGGASRAGRGLGRPGGRAGGREERSGAGGGRRASAEGAEELPRVCLRIAARLGAQPAQPDWTQTGAQPLAAGRPPGLLEQPPRSSGSALLGSAPGGARAWRGRAAAAVEPRVGPELAVAHL